MFRIRRIHDNILPRNKSAFAEVKAIFAEQFAAAPQSDIMLLEEKLENPFGMGFRHILYIAEDATHHVVGFAILLHEPDIGFSYLDYIATATRITGRGIGAALYEQLRDESLGLGAKGLFFESLPDEAARCSDPEMLRANRARLRFYEQYGARPVIQTRYEAALPGLSADNMPFLVYDDLDTGKPLGRSLAKKVVTAVLQRKYKGRLTAEYVNDVVSSFRDDPVLLRDFRYRKTPRPHRQANASAARRMPVAVNEKHDIHHVKDRGYVEAPVRISVILRELEAAQLITRVPVKSFPMTHIKAVHDADFVDYLRKACAGVPAGKSVYPYVFPVRNSNRAPADLSVRAGYYCIDTFTPLNQNAYLAAIGAVNCALTAADYVLAGHHVAYALVRPPGHHAEKRLFGGFCYFNNAAVAAHYLSAHGPVAILDIDYHHGNGQQEIFYQRSDVLTISIHGHPKFAYPYFTGFADERGSAAGEGYNLNIALPEVVDGARYREALTKACKVVSEFKPSFLILALGLDPAKGDPTGTWSLGAKDFKENGALLRRLNLPTLVVQEGGYRTRTLGTNAEHFFEGLLTK